MKLQRCKFKMPNPVCMECGEERPEVTEVVDTGGGVEELWVYCKVCNIETFHSLYEVTSLG